MKLLHCADLQLGLKLRYLPAETAARLRFIRFSTLRKIAELARDEAVDLVVVPGDVLEDNGLTHETLQQATDALACFDGIPVILMPGNHDAATPDSALARMDLPRGVILATRREPIAAGGALVYPCPLMRRHESDDPTAWLPERQPSDGIRIAMAHGGVINFAQSTETPNQIDIPAVEAKGYDYIALGDWHGTFRYSDRAWYSGAHEATRHKEVDPGNVLLVEITAAGELPRVRKVRVAQTHWLTHEVVFTDDSQVDALEAFLRALPERSNTLLDLRLSGSLSLAGRDALDVILDEYAQRLAHLRYSSDRLTVEPTEADLSAMTGEGFVAAALQRLRESTDPAAPNALRMLYRLQREVDNAAP